MTHQKPWPWTCILASMDKMPELSVGRAGPNWDMEPVMLESCETSHVPTHAVPDRITRAFPIKVQEKPYIIRLVAFMP